MRDKDRIDLDEVNKFHEVILTQVNEFSSIQLGLCLLHKITLPAVLTISEIKVTYYFYKLTLDLTGAADQLWYVCRAKIWISIPCRLDKKT